MEFSLKSTLSPFVHGNMAHTARIRLDYGEIEVVRFDRQEGGGWSRIELYYPDKPQTYSSGRVNSPIEERSHAASTDDMSRRWRIYPDYDSRCNCCYLNISHTEALHKRSVVR